MMHDPHAGYALLLLLGCPPDKVSRVYGSLAGQEAAQSNIDPAGALINQLRDAMHAEGIETGLPGVGWRFAPYDTDLVEQTFDGTFGASTTIRGVRTCHTCGALVDSAALDKHDAWHGVER